MKSEVSHGLFIAAVRGKRRRRKRTEKAHISHFVSGKQEIRQTNSLSRFKPSFCLLNAETVQQSNEFKLYTAFLFAQESDCFSPDSRRPSSRAPGTLPAAAA